MANEALINALTTAFQNLDRPSYRKFNGTTEEVEDWLVVYEAQAHRLTDEQKVNKLWTVLEGRAAEWLIQQKRSPSPPATWQQWKDALKQQFGRTKQDYLMQLTNRCQRFDENLIDYYHDVIQLCLHTNPQMNEEEKICHLIKGLLPEVKEKMLIMCPTSSNDFLSKLRVIASTGITSATSPMVTLLADLVQEVKELRLKATSTPALVQTEQPSTAEEIKKLKEEIDSLKGQIRRQTARPRPTCHNCGRTGHFRRDCRSRPERRSQDPRPSSPYPDRQRSTSRERSGNQYGRTTEGARHY